MEFKGEDGIDEGGLQKEFFQLIIEQLFDPMNGKGTWYGNEASLYGMGMRLVHMVWELGSHMAWE